MKGSLQCIGNRNTEGPKWSHVYTGHRWTPSWASSLGHSCLWHMLGPEFPFCLQRTGSYDSFGGEWLKKLVRQWRKCIVYVTQQSTCKTDTRSDLIQWPRWCHPGPSFSLSCWFTFDGTGFILKQLRVAPSAAAVSSLVVTKLFQQFPNSHAHTSPEGKAEGLPQAPTSPGRLYSCSWGMDYAAWPKSVRARPETGRVVIPHWMGTEQRGVHSWKENQRTMEAMGVNNKCSRQRLVASCFAVPFTTHLDFIFFCHKVTWGRQWVMGDGWCRLAGWIKTQMILWSPSPSPGSASPKQGTGSDGQHLAHRPPRSPLGPTAGIIHQSQDFSCAVQMWPQRPT